MNRSFGHRIGNHSAYSAAAHPQHQPAPEPEQVPDGWFCSVCLCVVRERAAHPGCRATPDQMSLHIKTATSTHS
jgi:hypothetical protein